MIYFLPFILSLCVTYYTLITTAQFNKQSVINIILRCMLSFMCGVGVLKCIKDLAGV